MSMQTAASPTIALKAPRRASLAHIPGNEGWPVIGRTLSILADPKGEVERMAAKYGLVYRSRVLGETSITVLGPDANELVLFDQSKLFSSSHGWGTILGRLFPRGLMLLDFDEHRLHRRALSVAFKSEPMKSYLAALDAGIAARVTRWRQLPGPILFYPAMKQFDETRDMIGEAMEEHQEVDQLLNDMATLSPGDDEFQDKLEELRDSVEHHIDEEENELFPRAEELCGDERLNEMGNQMLQMKQGKSARATNKQI